MSESVVSNPVEGPAILPQGERRSEVRQPCPYLPMVRLLVRPSFSCVRAFVQNVCARGIAFLLDGPLGPGDVVAFQLRNDERGQTRILSARVVHATEQAKGHWIIGCQLAGALTPEELEFLLERA
jgi:hypothetical protein